MKLIDIIRAQDKFAEREIAKAKNVFFAFKNGTISLHNMTIKYVFDDKNYKPTFIPNTDSANTHPPSKLYTTPPHTVTISLRKKNEGVYDSTQPKIRPFNLSVIESNGNVISLSQINYPVLFSKIDDQLKKIYKKFNMELSY